MDVLNYALLSIICLMPYYMRLYDHDRSYKYIYHALILLLYALLAQRVINIALQVEKD